MTTFNIITVCGIVFMLGYAFWVLYHAAKD